MFTPATTAAFTESRTASGKNGPTADGTTSGPGRRILSVTLLVSITRQRTNSIATKQTVKKQPSDQGTLTDITKAEARECPQAVSAASAEASEAAAAAVRSSRFWLQGRLLQGTIPSVKTSTGRM